ncbi:hypothetical protein MPLA_1840002 [Mesorhizobium sp. ORS 3359]|nr:hypothetical protein MPLA_1840002 [Mesorhizobium sp. ORS 3359]
MAKAAKAAKACHGMGGGADRSGPSDIAPSPQTTMSKGLERDLVVQLARRAATTTAFGTTAAATAETFVRAGLAEIGTAAAAAGIIADLSAAALAARVEHLQFTAEFLQHDLGRVAVIAGLVLPFAGLQLALDIDLHALLQILLGHLGELVVEDDDIVPLGLFLALARILVAPAFRGGYADVDDRIAGIQAADFWVRPEIADQNDLVDATRHRTSPRSSETNFKSLTLQPQGRPCP